MSWLPRLPSSFASRLLAWLLLCTVAFGLGGHAGEARAREAAPAIVEVDVADLPKEARDTLARIHRGGPFPYRKDGTAFFNREQLLPRQPRGYYTEYTVPTPRARDRGARRIVVGGKGGRFDAFYYTDDHYASFRKIRNPSP